MNIIEAVRELETNPKALSIQFEGKGGVVRELVVKDYDLCFRLLNGYFKPACLKIPFILREDFWVHYEKPPLGSKPDRLLTKAEIKQKVAELLDELTRR